MVQDDRQSDEAGMPPPRRGRGMGLRAVLAALVLAGLVGLGFLLARTEAGGQMSPDQLGQRILDWGAWGRIGVVGLMVAHSFVPFPAEVLALCAGMIYGTAEGTGLVWAGAMIGAGLSFGLARWLGRPFVDAALGARARARLDGWTVERGAVALLVARLIPVIAFNLINYAAGLTRVRWGTFLWTTGLGILPLTVLMVWMGAQMIELSWPWLVAVSAACILAVLAGAWWARRL